MMFRRFIIISGLILLSSSILYAEEQKPQPESDQQISEFSLSGYSEKGKKSWDIAGETADIFDNVIKLQKVVGNMYGEKEDVRLTADKGDFDKKEGKVHVEENVVINTSTGSKLTTDSLDWDRKNQLITTDDKVNITKENMVTKARGVIGEPGLNKVTLKKDVQVDINPVAKAEKTAEIKNKIVIICDGPLEINYDQNVATFKNNVKVDTGDNLMYSDVMDIYFIASGKDAKKEPDKSDKKETDQSASLMGTKIDKIIARGNVKIIRGENTSYSQEAVYTAFDKRIVLTGKPKLIIYSTEDLKSTFGGM